MPPPYDLLLEDIDDLLALESDDLLLLEWQLKIPAPWVRPKTWTIQLCHNSNTIATCTAFQFSALAQRNQGGEWTLDTSPAGVPPAGYEDPEGLEPGYVMFDPRDVTDIRLVGEGRILYAGAVHGENGGFYATRTVNGEQWRLSGVELGWHRLSSRLAFPDPTVASGWSVSHDERAGIASSVLAAYIEANAGSSAIAGRRITGLDVSDEAVGASDSFSTRFDTLAALATRIGSDYGFEVIPEYDYDGTITYLLTNPRDLSSVVVFSDRGDLLESSARFQQRDATYVLSAGTGEGTSRQFRSASTGATDTDRYEVLSDQSSLTSVGELQADAHATLAASGEQFSMTTTLSDAVALLAIQFGLRLGDRIGIIARERRYVAPIEAVQFEVTPQRQVMRPRFGAAEPDELRQLIRKVDGVEAQLRSSIA